MSKEEYKHSDITQKIIGAAMKVHSTLGNGFQEVIYQRALVIEFENSGLSFDRELEKTIYYGGQMIGTRRVDFLVEKKVYENRTKIEARQLNAEERVREIARMLGGQNTEITLAHAREMLKKRSVKS